MFEIGFWEIVLVFVVALVVVGPERLPGLARTAGLWIGKARRMVADVKDEVERELRVDELKRSISQQEAAEEIRRLADRVKSINTDIQTEVSKTLTPHLEAVSLTKSTSPQPPAEAVSPPDAVLPTASSTQPPADPTSPLNPPVQCE
jgi:sec-independent protein translocase protein TatB